MNWARSPTTFEDGVTCKISRLLVLKAAPREGASWPENEENGQVFLICRIHMVLLSIFTHLKSIQHFLPSCQHRHGWRHSPIALFSLPANTGMAGDIVPPHYSPFPPTQACINFLPSHQHRQAFPPFTPTQTGISSLHTNTGRHFLPFPCVCTHLGQVSKQLVGHGVHLLHLLKLVSQTKAEGLELQVSVLATCTHTHHTMYTHTPHNEYTHTQTHQC